MAVANSQLDHDFSIQRAIKAAVVMMALQQQSAAAPVRDWLVALCACSWAIVAFQKPLLLRVTTQLLPVSYTLLCQRQVE
eukprot:3298-Heterococcus_DN1.PRE.3